MTQFLPEVVERVADWLNAYKADPFSTGRDKAERCVEVVLEALAKAQGTTDGR